MSMSDFILLNGDQVMFIPTFGLANVIVRAANLQASGFATLQKKKICVEGDESKVSVPGCAYITAIHTIPGQGTLKISRLASNQITKKTYCVDKKVLLKGNQFNAVFRVGVPAQQLPPGTSPPISDSVTEYQGKGIFVTHNTKLQGS